MRTIKAHGREFASRAELRRFEASGGPAKAARAAEAEVRHEDCYVRHTDKDGKRFVQHHRVWNRDRFAKALARAAVQVGGKADAELITEQQYRKERTQEQHRSPHASQRRAR